MTNNTLKLMVMFKTFPDCFPNKFVVHTGIDHYLASEYRNS